MYSNLFDRKNNILSVFRQAKEDLEQLNKDIEAEMTTNSETITALQTEQANLKNLKSSNSSSIKGLVSFIGK